MILHLLPLRFLFLSPNQLHSACFLFCSQTGNLGSADSSYFADNLHSGDNSHSADNLHPADSLCSVVLPVLASES